MDHDRKHIVFLARWYPHRYDPMFGLFVQRHAEAAALYNDISVVYVHADDNATSKYEIVYDNDNSKNAKFCVSTKTETDCDI